MRRAGADADLRRLAWCRRSPTTWPRSTRRCGSATAGSTGPFELIDRLGADWLADAAQAAGLPVPPLLEAARGKQLLPRRERHARMPHAGRQLCAGSRRPEGVLLLADIKRAAKPVLRNGSANAVGHRRRRALPRVHQQDERARPRDHRPARQGARHGREVAPGPGDLQRGRELLGRRQSRHRHVRRQRRRLAGDRGAGQGRPGAPTRR